MDTAIALFVVSFLIVDQKLVVKWVLCYSRCAPGPGRRARAQRRL